MSIVQPTPREPMVGDPDDHRPNTMWRLVVDPGDASGAVAGLAVIEEAIAVGDRIPLHIHDVDEVIIFVAGSGQARLGDERQPAQAGTMVFVPAGAPHGTTNTGDQPLFLHAVFPSVEIDIEMLERNPAPGTESDPPRKSRYNLRTGEFHIVESADSR
ncbi:MAG TPA: cupin domain-containing protein [Candidatus Limnocylindrales bacterium]